MDIQVFQDLFDLGLHPIPLLWNEQTKQADHYPPHQTDIRSGNGKHNLDDVKRWLHSITNANGIALKMHPPFFMLDFDMKNTDDKDIFNQWLGAIEFTNSDILKKVCIEKTRSGGYHVYGKYKDVTHKMSYASSVDGLEVIALYTGGLLSFCYPTPGYELTHNEFADIEELTTKEFDLLSGTAIFFNKYEPKETEYKPGETIVYPVEYQSTANAFDVLCTDELFDSILNSIDLFPTGKTQTKENILYHLYIRQGSEAAFSGKVRFDKKRLFIFSASMKKFPNFHTRTTEHDHSWTLTPTRIIYYREGKDWIKTIQVIHEYCESFNIKIKEGREITQQPLRKADSSTFPYDIFPDKVQQYIQCQVIQSEYLAAAILAAVSGAIGNSAVLEAMPGYIIKPILYMAIVAPPGASKTPALNKAFKPLEDNDKLLYDGYEEKMKDYREKLAEYERDKKNNEKPEIPSYPQILIKDSTIEMVVKIMNYNQAGCCLVSDELVGFLNRMNQYKAGDEVQKWLEIWSGSPLLLQRVTREVNKIMNPFCSVIGGIQPGVLEAMSQDEKQHNGFYHRFLFMYPEPQRKPEWARVQVPYYLQEAYTNLFRDIIRDRYGDPRIYQLTPQAESTYKEWFDFKNVTYNSSTSETVKGIIAKYQDYCLRFALIIQVMTDGMLPGVEVDHISVERAIRLTEYFMAHMEKALKILSPETPLDQLPIDFRTLYESLPESFEAKEFIVFASQAGISEAKAKNFLNRNEGKLVRRVARGQYDRLL